MTDSPDTSTTGNGPNIPIIIAVATHKPYRMPTDPMYVPLHVGSALHPEVLPGVTGDETGDNISERNGYYSELTGLYWIWKNTRSQYKGLVHYRRYLGTKSIVRRTASADRFDRIIGESELRGILRSHDIVIAKRRNYYIETVRSHYAHTFHDVQFDVCRDVLCDLRPEYVAAWDTLMASRSAHIFNMFVMSAQKLDEYCSFIFPVLFEMERRLDPSQYDAFDARYLGRVSERLLDPWLETTGYSYEELPVVSAEPVNWLTKGGAFLMAKMGMKKYTKSF